MFGNGFPLGAKLSGIALLHAASGLAIIALVVVRIIWRAVNPPPPIEAIVRADGMAFSAALIHWALYGLLATTPIVGILLLLCRGDPVPVFGLIEIASPWRYQSIAISIKELHTMFANALVLCAAVHAAVALAHHVILRDRTLERMLPRVAR
jgi:cytochrome b561